MTSNEVLTQVRLSEWAREYQEFLESGLSIRKWCQITGMAETTFSYHNRKIRAMLGEQAEGMMISNTAPSSFVQIPANIVSDEPECRSDSCVHISADGKSIDIARDIPLDHFKMLLEVVFNAQ